MTLVIKILTNDLANYVLGDHNNNWIVLPNLRAAKIFPDGLKANNQRFCQMLVWTIRLINILTS